MNVNITLLTMMTWAARTSGLVVEPVDPWEVDIERIPGTSIPKEWGTQSVQETSVPFHMAWARCPGRPTRLADGLGPESARVYPKLPKTYAPVPACAGSLVPPFPHPAARN
jgi:hypothetical protein